MYCDSTAVTEQLRTLSHYICMHAVAAIILSTVVLYSFF